MNNAVISFLLINEYLFIIIIKCIWSFYIFILTGILKMICIAIYTNDIQKYFPVQCFIAKP